MTDVSHVHSDIRNVDMIIDDLSLFDDSLMSRVFHHNIPAAKRLLQIILKRDDIDVVSVQGQEELKSPAVGGRNVKLDILAKDKDGNYFNVEVQKKHSGANERRARLHSSMMDSRMLKAGQDFEDLMDSYMIFITEGDYLKMGYPLYTVHRYWEETKNLFPDGSHIIYVNGNYKGDDALGKLMHDMKCKTPDDFYYPELAEGVRHFKEKGGKGDMESLWDKSIRIISEEYARDFGIKTFIETCISFEASKEKILTDLCKKFSLSMEDAENYYEKYTATEIEN